MDIIRLIAVLQDVPEQSAGNGTAIRIGAGVLALILLGIVLMRRRKHTRKEDDEF